jgi:hypothetical protein
VADIEAAPDIGKIPDINKIMDGCDQWIDTGTASDPPVVALVTIIAPYAC